MPATWNIILSTANSDLAIIDALPWPVEVRAHPRARSLRLRIDETRGRFVLTHPRRMTRRAALDWASRQQDWAAQQFAGIAPAVPFVPGAVIPIEGIDRRIEWQARHPRKPALTGDSLRCGGPPESLPGRIERFLRTLARDRLSERTVEAAARAGVSVKSVAVADTRSRWGSCSPAGAIRYNWRLILAPPDLLDWVVAHEVAHRRHMNHGPDFRAFEASLFAGDVAAARARLRELGPRLKRVGRSI